jgi:hypothetical protein
MTEQSDSSDRPDKLVRSDIIFLLNFEFFVMIESLKRCNCK